MNDLRTAAQQALEAMRRAVPTGKITLYEWDRAISDLSAALAQQAEPVEPVATVTECEACFTPDVCQLRGTCDYYTASQMRIAAPPQQAEPVEPVYWEVRCTAHPKWMRVDEQQFDEYVAHGWEGQKLYTAPPQRKPLTEEEIAAEWQKASECASKSEGAVTTSQFVQMFARAVERAHGITGDNNG